MKKYKLEVTREQLILINQAVNMASRVIMGQFSEMVEMLRDGDGKYICDRELVEDVESLIKPKIGLGKGQSWGVNKFDDADILFTIHNCLRHQLWKENPNRSSATVDSSVHNWGGGLVGIEEI